VLALASRQLLGRFCCRVSTPWSLLGCIVTSFPFAFGWSNVRRDRLRSFVSVCLLFYTQPFFLTFSKMATTVCCVLVVLQLAVAVVSGVVVKDCDVLVLGGSTASVAAAWAASVSSKHVRVCLTEPTNWVGGQMTSSAVSAIDFGKQNSPDDGNGASNLPKSFLNLVNLFSESTGRCWVSERCYEPQNLVSHLDSLLADVNVFRETVVKNVKRDSKTGRIVSVSTVQRKAVGNLTGYEHLLSKVLDDW
jgi:hypothetical protein